MGRQRLMIIADVLKACSDRPLRITQINGKANINYFVAKPLVEKLHEKKLLLRHEPDKKRSLGQYETSPKGHQFLNVFGTLASLMNNPGEEVEGVFGTPDGMYFVEPLSFQEFLEYYRHTNNGNHNPDANACDLFKMLKENANIVDGDEEE